jgi:hypothetical protein
VVPRGDGGGVTTTAAPPDGGLRGNRDFLLLWSGAGISFLGSRVSAFAYPLIVLWVSGSPSAAGLITFAAQLPYLVVQLPAGVLVDRWDRRRLMLACDLGRFLAVGSIPLVLMLHGLSLVQLGLVAFVEGSLTVVYRITERAAVPSVVPKGQLTTAVARNEAREQGAGLLGQPAAGVLVTVTLWAPFLFTAIAHAFALVTVLGIRRALQEPQPDPSDAVADGRPAARRPVAEVVEGLVWMWHHRFARAAAGLIAVSNLLFQVLLMTVLVIIKNQGGTEAIASVVYVVSGIGGLLGALTATWWIRRVALHVLVIGANVVWALLVPFTAVAPGPVALGALYGVMAMVGAVWTVAVSAYLVRIVPDHLRGRVTSVATLLAYGPLAFGSLLGGFALSAFSVTGTVLGVSALMIALTALAAISPGVRRLPAGRHAQPDPARPGSARPAAARPGSARPDPAAQ